MFVVKNSRLAVKLWCSNTVRSEVIMFDQVALLPAWLVMAWIGACLLFSPFAIFFVVCLPQLPLLVIRRACHIPFEYIWYSFVFQSLDLFLCRYLGLLNHNVRFNITSVNLSSCFSNLGQFYIFKFRVSIGHNIRRLYVIGWIIWMILLWFVLKRVPKIKNILILIDE